MAQSNDLLLRYAWLVDLVRRHGSITFNDISSAWSRSTLNEKKGEGLPHRTFMRHIKAIHKIFGIKIACRRFDNTYHIVDDDVTDGNVLLAWAVNTLAIEMRLRYSPELKSRILLDAVEAGTEWLAAVVEAMDAGKVICLTYSAFHDAGSSEVLLEPYCLRSYGRRWYLLARSCSSGSLALYGLDRILALTVTEQDFTLPPGFDAAAFFSDFAGVITDCTCPVETVKISIDEDFAPHLRNVPLHHTQREGSIRYEDGSVDVTFEWRLRPTPDFLMELYRYGSSLEVIEPAWIREKIAAWAHHHSALYGPP